MTRSQIIKLVARAHPHLTKRDIMAIIDIFFDEISRALVNGDRVELRGFGSFGTKTRAPRIARNPRTGAKVDLNSRRAAYFRASRKLRDKVNQ